MCGVCVGVVRSQYRLFGGPVNRDVWWSPWTGATAASVCVCVCVCVSSLGNSYIKLFGADRENAQSTVLRV